jgi:hypothetical protein
MKLSQIAGTLGLDEVESVRPVPLTDDIAGAVPPRPKNRAERRSIDRSAARVARADRRVRTRV